MLNGIINKRETHLQNELLPLFTVAGFNVAKYYASTGKQKQVEDDDNMHFKE